MKHQEIYWAGFYAGLKHARDWCESNKTYIQEEINTLKQEYDFE